MNAEALYKKAVFLKPGQVPPVNQPYVISDDPRRGMRVIGFFDMAGKHTVYNIQRIPDTFADDTKMLRDRNAGMSQTRRIASGVQPIISIPHSMAQVVFSENKDGKKQIDKRDFDERDKRLKSIANDRDFYKLRISEGTV